ncbi:hypothetical protein KHC28_00805 [Ancylobacter sonchi]|uniref:hypothetical protein n=1 Tax=Ancylobacter sonchi TaxID=1937790 RepID=UPI001BD54BD6|nr:hypothetical protein [Ancylobacter sonchi]MBS7532203.1 hypothetical protein [Ancylobacter sonchi]
MPKSAPDIDAIIKKIDAAVIAEQEANGGEFGPATEIGPLNEALVEAVKAALYVLKTVMADTSNAVGVGEG